MVSKIKNILFICTGNSCRSVIAEALLKQMVKDKGCSDAKYLNLKIYSAGINPLENMHPPREAIKVLINKGIDVSEHKAKRVTKEMVENADLILTMERHHKDVILNMLTEQKDKVKLMKDFLDYKNDNLNIPDPIGKPLEVYETCLITIENCLNAMLKKIQDKL